MGFAKCGISRLLHALRGSFAARPKGVFHFWAGWSSAVCCPLSGSRACSFPSAAGLLSVPLRCASASWKNLWGAFKCPSGYHAHCTDCTARSAPCSMRHVNRAVCGELNRHLEFTVAREKYLCASMNSRVGEGGCGEQFVLISGKVAIAEH